MIKCINTIAPSLLVMLRASVRSSSKLFGPHPKFIKNGTCLWQSTSVDRSRVNTRNFADHVKATLKKSEPLSGSANPSASLFPSSNQTTVKAEYNPTVGSSTISSKDKIFPDKLPDIPSDSITSGDSTLPSPQPRRIFRKLLWSLILLGIVGYGGGIYFSTISDNFHDFFTEYVPFGEEAVLYLEEREFRKRFPDNQDLRTKDKGNLKSIGAQNGMSWRVAEEHKPGSTNRHTDATQPESKPLDLAKTKSVKAVETAKESVDSKTKKTPEVADLQPSVVKIEPSVTPGSEDISKLIESVPFTPPEVDQPSKFPPDTRKLELIVTSDADEPIVKAIAKIINNIIIVANADGSNSKLLGTIQGAKDDVSKLRDLVAVLKKKILKTAEDKIRAEKEDFDRAAKELIRRLETEMQLQQSNWQEEYQNERQKIQEAYDKKLDAEIQRVNEINEKRLNNALIEKEIEMRRKFTQEIKDRVEEERNSRLGKLSDLSNSVNELEKLTTDVNSVLDYNLKTQHLHVAVEAVRAYLEKADGPRPFVRELVALREIASDDPVVNAAIASINPISYQRGIPSPAQVIDRFRRVATEVRKTALLPEDAGVASHATSYLLSKVLFKKKGQVSGDDLESVLTRAEMYLEEGQLDAAAREVNGLKGWPKILSRDWLDEVRRVLEVRQALDIIATEARLKSLSLE